MTPNTPTPDYGEPLRATFGPLRNAVRDRNGQLTNLEWALRDRAIACVNACAGMADPEKEIKAMREAIREAHEAIKVSPYPDQQALAKLQPYITT